MSFAAATMREGIIAGEDPDRKLPMYQLHWDQSESQVDKVTQQIQAPQEVVNTRQDVQYFQDSDTARSSVPGHGPVETSVFRVFQRRFADHGIETVHVAFLRTNSPACQLQPQQPIKPHPQRMTPSSQHGGTLAREDTKPQLGTSQFSIP